MTEPRHSHEDASDDPWETTSLKMRRSTRRAVKIYAAEHDMTMQSVLEEALLRLLSEK
ncbi:chromosome partitioning protein ParA [Bifidobacterium simiarum]|uniref:Chromosome partitioning protein ParA n=1 Tax=Bifidobacterium simiarum TaxID=2045441 RepID=A0A2M9HE43_9BIFI|nr:chromosome partitioning protein ParA [Bifidobacterium simiarum]